MESQEKEKKPRSRRNSTSTNTGSPIVSRLGSICMQDSQDPLEDYQQGDHVKSLLYGLDDYRFKTRKRLDEEGIKLEQPPDQFDTIDGYNDAIGIADMIQEDPAVNIFKIREALEDPKNWRSFFPNAPSSVTEEGNPLKLWIDKLVANKHDIGLYDLGDISIIPSDPEMTKGEKKIDSKDRLGKNDTTEGKAVIMSSDDINEWLSYDYSTALNGYNGLPEEESAALNNWIYRAFIRRTSKLGIDFATQDLDAKVHFNKAGAIDHKSSNPTDSRVIPEGLILNSEMANQSQDRPITISEIRHAAKQVKKDIIPKEKINTYNEL